MSLPFKDGSWDVVASFDVIEHLTHPDALITEAFRVLVEGGAFIVSTPNLADLYSRINLLLGYPPLSYDSSVYRTPKPLSKSFKTERSHKSVFTYRGLNTLLSASGFRIVDSCGYDYADAFSDKLNPNQRRREVGFFRTRRVLSRFLPQTLAEGMLFVCKK
jgi:SAM-dependent methyltransferase